MEDRREKIQEIAKQVAEVLARNGVTYREVPRIFVATEYYLSVSLDPRAN